MQEKEIRLLVLELYVVLLEGGGISATQLYQYGHYQHILREIGRILDSTAAQQAMILERELGQAYRAAYEKPLFGSSVAVLWGLQSQYAMEQVINGNYKGSNFSDRIWKGRQATFDLLKKEIEKIVISGQSKDEAVKVIRQAAGASFSNADRLVRTETMRVINAARRQRFLENGYTHGYYVAAKDDRLCAYCNKMAANTKANPMPLQEMDDCHHPNCRCTICADLKSRK